MSIKTRMIVFIGFMLFAMFYNSFFPRFLITGKYVADITDEFASFNVKNGDKLIINEDGTFNSDSWGKGRYILKGSKIQFNCEDITIHTNFYRPLFFGKPRVIIFEDLNAEFVKK